MNPGRETRVKRHHVARGIAFVLAALLALPLCAQEAEDEGSWDDAKVKARREVLDAMARETLDKVVASSQEAKLLLARSFAYAVFDNAKLSLGVSGGGGQGVAAVLDGSERVYMKMGTVGLNLGFGAKKYQVVFLFQTRERFRQFVDAGWQADAGASATLGEKGVGDQVNFVNGMAVYQVSEKGLALEADIAGTKYWKDKKLNP
jgi:lipid-binding SYLF domain-containing protein